MSTTIIEVPALTPEQADQLEKQHQKEVAAKIRRADFDMGASTKNLRLPTGLPNRK